MSFEALFDVIDRYRDALLSAREGELAADDLFDEELTERINCHRLTLLDVLDRLDVLALSGGEPELEVLRGDA